MFSIHLKANSRSSSRAGSRLRRHPDILVLKNRVKIENVEIQKKLESTSQSLDSLGDTVQETTIIMVSAEQGSRNDVEAASLSFSHDGCHP